MKYGFFIIIQLSIFSMSFGQEQKYYIPFKQGNLWSIADKNGAIQFEPRFEETFPSTFSRIKIRQGDKFGFINPKGAVIIDPIYEKATDYYYYGGKSHSYVTLNDSSFYVDLDGNKTIPIFGCGGSSSNMPNGLNIFKVNGNYGLLSIHGDTLAKPVFTDIRNYNDGNFVVAQNSKMKYGLIDSKGDTIYPFTLDSVKYERYNTRNTYYRIYDGNLTGVVDLIGQVQVDPQYEGLEFYPHFEKGLCFKAKKGDLILGYVYKRKEYWRK